MNNTTTAPVSIFITECPDHGIKATSDEATARACVSFARQDAFEIALFERHGVADQHDAEYHDDGTDCWVCCEKMVIDPHGVFDH